MPKKFNVTGVCIPEKHYMADLGKNWTPSLQIILKKENIL